MPPDLRFAISGDIETRTGGYIYDRRLMHELRQAGSAVEHLRWPASFPFPNDTDLAAAESSLAACPDGSTILVDGLAYGAIPALAESEGRRLRFVALIHHPLALESGLTEEQRGRLVSSERRALAMARAVIATSGTTAAALVADYGVESARITVARPGSDTALPLARGDRAKGAALHLLSVGTVTPRKGHDVLVEALDRIADIPWTCTIAGSLERAPETAAAIAAQIRNFGLGERISLAGEVADVAALYRNADIFVLPSRHEGYGMAFAEAMRHGLPIAATNAGAIPELVPTSAGILVPIDDFPALASALRLLLTDAARRRRLAEGARAFAATLPTWEETAAIVARALRAIS